MGRNSSRTLVLSLLTALLLPSVVQAFCGFYVAGSGERLMNEATQVALMRDGTRTVLSMRNNYRGPLQDFAMVVPVPVVLQQENVRTLEHALFDRLEALTAPRLVEYWEQDPCARVEERDFAVRTSRPRSSPRRAAARPSGELGVTIEAQFAVGEYDIVILSATESAGLETWLRREHYQVPAGAAAALAPYIRDGWKFFAAKVDIERITQRRPDGSVQLSPLRFHYDSAEFRLPVRLGLLNAGAQQDLVVYILHPRSRFEVANYPNAFIPTNLDVSEDVRASFGSFYAELFDRTVQRNGGNAVVTEYAWDTSNCDPCAGPPLTSTDLASLGGDVRPPPPPPPPNDFGINDLKDGDGPYSCRPRVNPNNRPSPLRRSFWGWGGGMVVSRLHARYSAATLTEDLVFREAAPVTGGREAFSAPGQLERSGVVGGSINNFQGRYAIRHPWTGPMNCPNPRRGVWGGPPTGGGTSASAATELAFARRGVVALASAVLSPVAELGLAGVPNPPSSIASAPPPVPTDPNIERLQNQIRQMQSQRREVETPRREPASSAARCGCTTPGHSSAPHGALVLAGVCAVFFSRRRKR